MIEIKTKEEIEIMRQSGKILASVMEELSGQVRPGISTEELERFAENLILKSGGRCAFKGYQNYPACLCTSINEEIVHAIPSKRIIKEGDIISLDLGVEYKGFNTDMAVTLPVGRISAEAKKLIEVTKKSLEEGIKKIKPGNQIGEISRTVQKYVESYGFGVVRELCGHGIGREVHQEPDILNYVSLDKKSADKAIFKEDAKIELKEGMVICLEPMVTMGDWHIKKMKDGFGYRTKDNSLSAHFEHTIAVTKGGHEVLTKFK